MASSAKRRKPGVAELAELSEFVQQPGLTVVDVRNNNPEIEEESTISIGPLAETEGCNRPSALNIVFDRASKTMELPAKLMEKGKDVPIITH